jgi:hypothetical protein
MQYLLLVFTIFEVLEGQIHGENELKTSNRNERHIIIGDGSQVNGLGRQKCEGVMFLDWSTVCCSVLLCYNCVQSGMLHIECIRGGVAKAGSWHSIYQSIIQTINGDLTVL